MIEKNSSVKKRIWRVIIIIVAVVLLLASAFYYYVNQAYEPSDAAIAILSETETDEYTIEETAGERIVFTPTGEITAGIIFYPGGKVEYEAYVPLMQKLAKSGYLCVLLHMPYNLAIFDEDAADGIISEFSEVDSWYLSGHSLGGVFACRYAAKHTEDYKGLILLGAYADCDLSDTDLNVLCIYGSNDGVMNLQKYENAKANLPDSFEEFVIDGGNHAYFGDYGEQSGDGTAEISVDEQMESTVDAITNWMGLYE